MTRLGSPLNAAASAWARFRAHVPDRQRNVAEAPLVLCISVSEAGWTTSLLDPSGQVLETSADEGTVPDLSPTTPVETLRRAVRAISAPRRERIGNVRLLISDPAVSVVDNRFARIRSKDPTVIRQAAAQEVGTKDAIFGFQPFGRSSEHEVERGAYAFLSSDFARDYLAALDSLAVKLVQLVPASLYRLAVGADGAAFAVIDVRASSSSLLLADPDTGAVVCRELGPGTRALASAIAAATSISLKEAAQGLERRACFRADAAAEDAPAPLTATERALHPLLALLRTELLASMEYFLFQRLAGAPNRLIITGEVERVRGLAAWFAGVLGAEPEIVSGSGFHAQFVATPPSACPSLLEGAPKGLLKLGKTNYHFVDGRFRPDQPEAPRRGGSTRPVGQRRNMPLTVERVREAFTSVGSLRRIAPAALTLAAFIALLWATVSVSADELDRAGTVLSAGLAEDSVLRSSLARRISTLQGASGPIHLYWTEKLLAITRAVPDGVRLTKLVVSPGAAKAAGDGRLVIEGEVSAADRDYLVRITDLTDRLTRDTGFMRDVKSVGVDGASVSSGPVHDIAHFTVTVLLGQRGARGG